MRGRGIHRHIKGSSWEPQHVTFIVFTPAVILSFDVLKAKHAGGDLVVVNKVRVP